MNFLDSLVNEAKKKKKQVQTAVTGRGGLIDDIQGAGSRVVKPLTSVDNFAKAQSGLANFAGNRITQSPIAKVVNNTYKILDNSRVGDTKLWQTDKALAAGGVRSGIGTLQGASGLVDLASKGTGTNRFSKALDNSAKSVDNYAKSNKLPTVAYKAGQLGGDLATGGAVGKALSIPTKAPAVITKVTRSLTKGNAAQRLIGNSVRNISNPAVQAANVGWTGLETGKTASRGRDVNARDVALQGSIGAVGFPVAGAVGREIAVPVINKGFSTLRNNNVIAPSKLNRVEIENLREFNTKRGTYDQTDQTLQNGQQAAQRAGIDYRDSNQVNDLLARHDAYDTKVMELTLLLMAGGYLIMSAAPKIRVDV